MWAKSVIWQWGPKGMNKILWAAPFTSLALLPFLGMLSRQSVNHPYSISWCHNEIYDYGPLGLRLVLLPIPRPFHIPSNSALALSRCIATREQDHTPSCKKAQSGRGEEVAEHTPSCTTRMVGNFHASRHGHKLISG